MQPDPKPNNLKTTQEMVIEDLKARLKLGMERYGVGLQPFNGRNSLQDLYEEILDGAVYVRNEMREQNSYRNALLTIIDMHSQGAPSWQLAEIAVEAVKGVEFSEPEDFDWHLMGPDPEDAIEVCCGGGCHACDE